MKPDAKNGWEFLFCGWRDGVNHSDAIFDQLKTT